MAGFYYKGVFVTADEYKNIRKAVYEEYRASYIEGLMEIACESEESTVMFLWDNMA